MQQNITHKYIFHKNIYLYAYRYINGFSMIETGISLIIIGIIFTVLLPSVSLHSINLSQTSLHVRALNKFTKQYARIPYAGNEYGTEVTGLTVGIIPWQTLGLKKTNAYYNINIKYAQSILDRLKFFTQLVSRINQPSSQRNSIPSFNSDTENNELICTIHTIKLLKKDLFPTYSPIRIPTLKVQYNKLLDQKTITIANQQYTLHHVDVLKIITEHNAYTQVIPRPQLLKQKPIQTYIIP